MQSEQQRRTLFKGVVHVGLAMSLSLYVLLAFWIFNNDQGNSAWHIASILALPATTILFLLIKILAKRDSDGVKEKESSTPAGEFMDKCADIVKALLDLVKRR